MVNRAEEALKIFPLPHCNKTSTENYQEILRWLYSGNVAALLIELSRKPR